MDVQNLEEIAGATDRANPMAFDVLLPPGVKILSRKYVPGFIKDVKQGGGKCVVSRRRRGEESRGEEGSGRG